jgi:molybdate transport system regulatory protein
MGQKTRHKNGEQTKEDAPGWHGRVWLEGNEGTLIGFGRAVLLEKIQEHGSIAKATREMNMSYKHGWNLLESMKRQAGSAAVITSRGGKNGGGAVLTPTGEKLLAGFWRIQEKMKLFLAEETALWMEDENESSL